MDKLILKRNKVNVLLFYRNVSDLLHYMDDEKNGSRNRVLVISDGWVEHCYRLVLIIHVIECIDQKALKILRNSGKNLGNKPTIEDKNP